MSCQSCYTEFSWTTWKHICPKDEGGCGGLFCGNCRSYAVMPSKEETKGLKGKISLFCKGCFQNNSLLDFSKNIEIIGGENGTVPSVVFVHGGGGCRNMFQIHAQRLSDSKGYRCVLIDLPGHGGRMDEPLSLDSALQVIIDSIKTYASPCNGIQPVYIGGSLGGYLGMELVGKEPNLVSAAIICMAGQNVGVGRGWAAGLGLLAFDLIIPNLSEGTLLSGLIQEASKNGHMPLEIIVSMSLRTGSFFHQGPELVQILRQSNPPPSLQQFPGKILFINGSKDHGDSAHLWLEASQQGRLLIYEGGDHFFSHDDRFMDRFIQDCQDFIEDVNHGGNSSISPSLSPTPTPSPSLSHSPSPSPSPLESPTPISLAPSPLISPPESNDEK